MAMPPSADTQLEDGASLRALENACALPLRAFREGHVRKQVGETMEAAGVGSIKELVSLLQDDPVLRRRLRSRVANSLTSPFRDPEQFELIRDELLPPLRATGGELRVWSAGCSDGSEVFSLAELLDAEGALDGAHLLGSDILAENVVKARAATGRMPPAVARRLRWEQRDLSADGPPAGRWDLVLCRNVAIYLRPGARERVHRTLVSSLAPAGVLLLGRSERLVGTRRLGLCEVAPHAYRRAS